MPPRATSPRATGRPRDAPPADAARIRRGASAWQDGLRAEQAAADALLARGWTLLGRRMRTEAGEIDIVAARSGLLAFVEVKARATLREAAAALTVRQQERLRMAAELLLARHAHWPREAIRFDLLLVDRAGTVRRIADAIRD